MLGRGELWISGVVVLFLARGAAGASPSQPAAAWTTEARLHARFDPDEMSKRREAQADKAHRMGVQGLVSPAQEMAATGSGADAISGKETPYLFLPNELFDALLASGYPGQGRPALVRRGEIEARAAALGLGGDMWTRLQRAAGTYISLRNAPPAKSVTPLLQDAAEGSEERTICRTRFRALGAARREFGAEVFDRLLYEGVAPLLSMSYVVRPGLEESMRLAEEGCP